MPGQNMVMPQFIAQHFSLSSLLGISILFFVVTMASQNGSGIAMLKAHDYTLPVSPRLLPQSAWGRRCTVTRSCATGSPASLQRALSDEKQRDAAAIAFLITAPGITLLGVGTAFWGLIGEVIAHLILTPVKH